MGNDFRTRILPPLLILLALLAGIAAFAFSVSRVFLAVPEIVATFAALAIATYVLFMAAFIGKQRRLATSTLGAVLVVGLVAVVAAGVVAAQAGIRELHPEEEVDPDEAPAEPGFGETVEEIPPDAHVWVAIDIDYSEAPTEMPAGEVAIALDNEGNLVHNVVFEGTGVKVEVDGGQKAVGTFTVDPGSYVYFCDVPGHRAAGMEGEIEVTE